MKRLVLLYTIATIGVIGTFGSKAMAAAEPKIYTTVDSVSGAGHRLTITGIVQGEGSVSTKAYSFSSMDYASDYFQSCERKALMAMAKPGQYLFSIVINYNSYSYIESCTLARVNP